MDDLGSYVSLYLANDPSPWWVQTHHEAEIDAAVSRWIDSRFTHDTLLDLTTLEGFGLRVRASQLGPWSLNTPQARHNRVKLMTIARAEERSIRHELGIWDEDEDEDSE